jgi:hypothetical protein
MKKIKEIMQFFECFLLNPMKNEENKGKMQFFEFFLLNSMKNEENEAINAIF